ncbi:glycosyltransferase family 4 protein [Pseudoalteromonas xiamenensis]
MKILILSFYFKPDLSAGSFRITSLVEQLKQHKNIEIDVITSMPNRYASFSVGADNIEIYDNVRVRRIELPAHKSGMLDQVNAFYTYYMQVQKLVENESYDLVFATSSRLFTAFLGARIAKKRKLPLYLDIRDIFVDTIKDVMPKASAYFLKPILTIIEKYTFSSAEHINLVSMGFSGYFNERYSKINYTWFTNGIDEEFLNLPSPNAIVLSSSNSAHVQLVYAGNIGEGQGLHTILPNFLSGLSNRYTFKVIGDGGRRQQLLENTSDFKNFEILAPVSRDKLIQEYLKADILFLHLNDYPAFEKVLPSKIFEYAATGKPILAGVSGYAAEFIKSEIKNAEVFYPGDHVGALRALSRLKTGYTDRTSFVTKYTRANIMRGMCESIVDLVT